MMSTQKENHKNTVCSFLRSIASKSSEITFLTEKQNQTYTYSERTKNQFKITIIFRISNRSQNELTKFPPEFWISQQNKTIQKISRYKERRLIASYSNTISDPSKIKHTNIVPASSGSLADFSKFFHNSQQNKMVNQCHLCSRKYF